MTDNTSPLQERLQQVRGRIRTAEDRFGRSAESVTLIAVSKGRTADELRACCELGQWRFGENYLQEAVSKMEALAGVAIEWHFIGPIQSNKTRTLAERFDWVQSVDRIKIAERLNEQRPQGRPPLNVCLQVNISREGTKSGVELHEAPELAAAIASLPHLQLRGLMAIPAPERDFEQQRIAYRPLRELFERLKADYPGIDTLSIGMSDDLEAAVAEGATVVRIGTALFGPRPHKGS